MNCGIATVVEQVVVQLLTEIGELWRAGDLRIAHEHMATAVLRSSLGNMLDTFHPSEFAPLLIVTTPLGQFHELGALIVAIVAATEGWRALYLGPNLPATEIAGSAFQSNAAAVALSIVFPPDDPRIGVELLALRKALGSTPLIVGGRDAMA